MVGTYSYFGYNVARYRYKRKFTSTQMAEYLGMTGREYMQIEAGTILPSPKQILELSRTLKIDPARIKRWLSMAARQREVSETAFKGAARYLKELEDGVRRVEEKHKEMTAEKLNAKQKQLLLNLQRDVCKLFDFPILPMNYILILDSLSSVEVQSKKYLHEITDFLLDDESLDRFVSRHSYLGPFIFYAANQTFFSNRPLQSIEECFNQLTIDQFRELVWMATFRNGVYDVGQEVAILQKHEDFQALGALMARELEGFLPESVNYSHLYQACLLKDMGTYALYTLLKPTIRTQQAEVDFLKEDPYSGLVPSLMDLITYELHPAVSGMIGANWNFPTEVLDAVVHHHHDPVREVTPLCAMLKIINSFVDWDFPDMSKEAILDILKSYPQISMKPENLFAVVTKLKQLRDDLYTRSSHALDNTSQKIRSYTSPPKGGMQPHMSMFYQRIGITEKRSNLRVDQGYQSVTVNVAQPRHQQFIQSILTPKKREPLKNYEYRLGNQFLRLRLAVTNDVQSAAEEHGVSPEEVATRILGK